MKKLVFCTVSVLLFNVGAFAQHNHSGEIVEPLEILPVYHNEMDKFLSITGTGSRWTLRDEELLSADVNDKYFSKSSEVVGVGKERVLTQHIAGKSILVTDPYKPTITGEGTLLIGDSLYAKTIKTVEKVEEGSDGQKSNIQTYKLIHKWYSLQGDNTPLLVIEENAVLVSDLGLVKTEKRILVSKEVKAHLASSLGFVVYPNPVQNQINASFFVTKGTKTIELKIRTLQGKTVLSRKESVDDYGDKTLTIPSVNLAEGFYIAELYFGDKLMNSSKIIVQSNSK